MSDNALILKGTLKIIGRVKRDDQNQIISIEIKDPYIFPDDVTEYTDKLYESDGMTIAYVWDPLLQIHRLKNNQDKLDKIIESKLEDLKELSTIKVSTLYEGMRISTAKLVSEVWAHLAPAAKLPLTGDIATLAGYKSIDDTHRTNIKAYTLTGNTALGETYLTEQEALNAAIAYDINTGGW